MAKTNPIEKLKLILNDPLQRAKFRKHLLNEYSVENLEFYEEYEKFVKTADLYCDSDNHKTVMYMYKKFISSMADFQVNISSQVKERIEIRIKEGIDKPEIFEMAANEIFGLMAIDSLSRFDG